MATRMLFLASFLLSLPAWAAAQDDPLMGTWKANYAKSYPPRPGARSYTITRVPYGRDGEKYTGEVVRANGQTLHMTSEVEFDGKDYPFKGNPARDTVSVERVDAQTTVQTFKKAGKIVGVNTRIVSNDGKTLYVLSQSADAQGQLQKIPAITVWDKQ